MPPKRRNSRSKSFSILKRGDKGLDHFRLNKVAVEAVQLVQPEVVAGEVSVGEVIWISSQVTKVLHVHERPIHLSTLERGILRDVKQGSSSGRRIRSSRGAAELGDGVTSLSSRRCDRGVQVKFVHI